jgi:hypothetical protein
VEADSQPYLVWIGRVLWLDYFVTHLAGNRPGKVATLPRHLLVGLEPPAVLLCVIVYILRALHSSVQPVRTPFSQLASHITLAETTCISRVVLLNRSKAFPPAAKRAPNF